VSARRATALLSAVFVGAAGLTAATGAASAEDVHASAPVPYPGPYDFSALVTCGHPVTWKQPAGIETATVVAIGGRGGASASGTLGGAGGAAASALMLPPGATVTGTGGCDGQPAPADSTAGGAGGGTGMFSGRRGGRAATVGEGGGGGGEAARWFQPDLPQYSYAVAGGGGGAGGGAGGATGGRGDHDGGDATNGGTGGSVGTFQLPGLGGDLGGGSGAATTGGLGGGTSALAGATGGGGGGGGVPGGGGGGAGTHGLSGGGGGGGGRSSGFYGTSSRIIRLVGGGTEGGTIFSQEVTAASPGPTHHGVVVTNIPILDGPSWPGWNIARSVATSPTGPGGWILDGFGGVHVFRQGRNSPRGPVPGTVRGAPYWNGWDIARGIAVLPDGSGGYVLDGFGGLHPFRIGSGALPPKVTDAPYWNGWDIARSVAILPDGSGGYVLDGFGAVHAFTIHGPKPPPTPVPGWFTPGYEMRSPTGLTIPYQGATGLGGYLLVYGYPFPWGTVAGQRPSGAVTLNLDFRPINAIAAFTGGWGGVMLLGDGTLRLFSAAGNPFARPPA
jgi:hypothetical protein